MKWIVAVLAASLALWWVPGAWAPGGTVLEFEDTTWTCNSSVSSLATSGLPLKVHLDYTDNYAGQGARIGAGCVGPDTSNTIDLYIWVNGDGVTHGTQDDAIRVLNFAPTTDQNLDIAADADCGRNESLEDANPANDFHQDGIHAISGNGIRFYNSEVGDYDNGIATCAGAAGAVFFSGSGSNAPVNMVIDGGKFIACNHAVIDGDNPSGADATGSISGASFRSGRNFANTDPEVEGLCEKPGTDPVAPYATGNSDLSNTGVTETGVTLQYWEDNDWETQ